LDISKRNPGTQGIFCPQCRGELDDAQLAVLKQAGGAKPTTTRMIAAEVDYLPLVLQVAMANRRLRWLLRHSPSIRSWRTAAEARFREEAAKYAETVARVIARASPNTECEAVYRWVSRDSNIDAVLRELPPERPWWKFWQEARR
jgi:hypothetical protein